MSAAHERIIIVERAAAQNTAHIIRCIKLLAAIIELIRIFKIRLLPIIVFSPQTPRPFPHVAAHFLAAIRAGAVCKTANRICCADAGITVIGAVRIGFITLGITPLNMQIFWTRSKLFCGNFVERGNDKIRRNFQTAACRFFPFGFRG